jgi:FkbM family methyltransferase
MQLSRIQDLTGKAWRYLLAALERPGQLPRYTVLPLKGVHFGEFIKLNHSWIREAGIRTVIDVGAHSGEFSSAMHAVLPDAHIYAFEPLEDCHRRLRQRLGGNGSLDSFQVAVGERRGEIEFWRSSFPKSSSALAMSTLHQTAFPWSAKNERLTVQLETLDHCIGDRELPGKVFLKIDVQGYDDRVLKGASQLLKRIDYVLVEVSFRPLYEGQAKFHDIYDILRTEGFSYAGNMEQLLSPQDGSVLQADALFVRNA